MNNKKLLFTGAINELLAVFAATIAVPTIIGISQSAALFGAGAGTLIYLLCTQFKSPVFLGSSFAFIGAATIAFKALGYTGLMVGAIIAGLVYILIALLTHKININVPPVIIGPTVAIIGLSLAKNAVADIGTEPKALICAFITLIIIIVAAVFGNNFIKSIPFFVGILGGYIVAYILGIVSTPSFNTIFSIPDFTFLHFEPNMANMQNIVLLFFIYAPVALVAFSEHLADHKNLSNIIGKDLLKEPGLSRTLIGDGVGSIVGAFFGGCPNTTYGESIACVAITKNYSTITTAATAILAIILSFFTPFTALLSTIPACVMGGTCITLYGFIAVSGFKIMQDVDFNDNKNILIASTILVLGVGGMSLNIKGIIISEVAVALLSGLALDLIIKLIKRFI